MRSDRQRVEIAFSVTRVIAPSHRQRGCWLVQGGQVRAMLGGLLARSRATGR
jgi:hypothetical protein